MSGEDREKPTLEETMKRNKPLFVMVMAFPLIGMFAALAVVFLRPNRNTWIAAGALVCLIVFYAATNIYLLLKYDKIFGKKN